jgi:HEAT repeat protein
MKAANKQEIISASLLINELTDEDANKRKIAASSLKTIGQALGPARIKTELIPHLRECRYLITKKLQMTMTHKS